MRTTAIAILVLLAGCTSPEPELDTAADEIQGEPNFNACDPVDTKLLADAMHLGRVASISAEVETCLQAVVPIAVGCSTDPATYQATPIAQRWSIVLDALRTDNVPRIWCDGVAAGQAAFTDGAFEIAPNGREFFTFTRLYLDFLRADLAKPLCAPGVSSPTCRAPNGPWMEAAGTAWHESTHSHGYDHNYLDGTGCQSGGTSVIGQSVPYLVGACVRDALAHAGTTCGDRATCGVAGLLMPDALGSTTCVCVEDPGPACWDNVDTDHDGTGNRCDACPLSTNQSTTNTDGDARLDACDNCPAIANSAQDDGDHDGRGNVCDNCPAIANAGQTDGDNDHLGDVCDNCPAAWNHGQSDFDGDHAGDACDADIDNDGLANGPDLCDYLASSNNNDADHDGVGDPCDGCDLVRGLTYDCVPLGQVLRGYLDDRLESFGREIRAYQYAGPWGPWDPFTTCMWRCDENATRHAARVQAARAWIQANPGKAPTDATMRQLLRAEDGATTAAVDRFLSERLRPWY